MPDWNIPFKLYIDGCGDGLGAALHKAQIIGDKPTEGPACYISRQIKPIEARYGAIQMKCLYISTEGSHSTLDYATIIKSFIDKPYEHADGLSRWALANTPVNPAYVPLGEAAQIPIEGINITDIGTEFFEQVKESYKQDKKCHILTSLIDKVFKYKFLVKALDEVWKNSYAEGRFHFFDGIIYHRTKHSCVMTMCSRLLINTILHE
ncbi:hypothetical protein O181_088078 [Austropuccinia psidii MF-1]|uniref:Reverse transcriptase RNase H-like domain-containing protein n=1 Tax=Austropuccinia psidii MF-1 TaxID=1389203 RepID=A0A9Q3IQW6_9BASI|nr:hypothetical protein [Austropuccinia psidii MF-1]